MSTTNSVFFDMAQLAEASYANLVGGDAVLKAQ
jgi:hypothetical protein